MKKISLFFFLMGLLTTFSIYGHNGQDSFAENFLVDSDYSYKEDGFTEIECNLYSIERRSNFPGSGRVATLGGDGAGTTSTAHNWSGYAAFTGTSSTSNPTFDTVTMVRGSWTVPTVSVSAGGGYFFCGLARN